jgi:putative ABC transport system ATP-binding protein
MKLIHVYKTFYPDSPKEVKALTDINLTFEKGEFTTLSGESGSGKTTLLNIIGGLDSATSGQIFLDDEEISAYSEEKMAKLRLHDIGFIFQAYNLIHVLTVRENIGFIMKLLKFDDKEIDTRILELASILKIENILDKLPGEISGGQQQRVAVARAVASRPKFILADEPTANLDSKNSERLMEMLRTLNEKEHVTVIFASHDKYVLEQSKRIIVLDDGVIIEDR